MDVEENEVLAMDQEELVDKPTLDHEPEPVAEPEDQPRGPDGKFASKDTGEKPQETEAPPAPENVPVKALQDERRKRQELEQQIAELQRQVVQPKPQEAPDFWENPDAAMQQRFEQFGEQLLQRFQQQQQLERINASEAAAKVRHTDYDDAFRAFQQAAMANPSLVQQMTGASDPAEFAYQRGKTALALEKVGSVEELRQQIRAEVEAEAKAAMPKPSFPTSTVSDGSAAPRGGPVWSGPVSDREILPMG